MKSTREAQQPELAQYIDLWECLKIWSEHSSKPTDKRRNAVGEKFRLYALAHGAGLDKMIDVHGIADYRTEVTEETTPFNGEVDVLRESFKAMKEPGVVIFSLKEKLSRSLFTKLKPGHMFTLELRIQVIKDNQGAIFHTEFKFHRCMLVAVVPKGRKVRVVAGFGSFRYSDP